MRRDQNPIKKALLDVAEFIWLHAQLAYFKWTLASNQNYARACRSGGIWWDTNTLKAWRLQEQADIARIVQIEARLYPITRNQS